MDDHHISRRRLARGAAWSVPVVVSAAAVPAVAASPTNPDFAVLFDGGGGANGYLNSTYVNLGVPATNSPITLQATVTVVINVVGLLATATDERTFTAGASIGDISRGKYNSATRTTTITWTIPAGTQIPKIGTGSNVPDVLFSFGGGASGAGRITNKLVVVSVSGGTVVSPQSVPVDSSIVKDVSGVSPDGIY